MQTLLICLLLLYNAWLVAYILQGKRPKAPTSTADAPHIQSAQKADDIVGKSLFRMEPKEPQATIPEPQTAKAEEDEDVTDIAVTFADGNADEPSARLDGEELEAAFEDIRMDDVPQEYDEQEQELLAKKGYASGASFEEIGEAVHIADNPVATASERRRAGRIFSDMEGDDLFNKMTQGQTKLAKQITGLMDEFSGKLISGEGNEVGDEVQPPTTLEVPTDISGFNIRDFV